MLGSAVASTVPVFEKRTYDAAMMRFKSKDTEQGHSVFFLNTGTLD